MLICAQRYFPCQNQKKINSLSMVDKDWRMKIADCRLIKYKPLLLSIGKSTIYPQQSTVIAVSPRYTSQTCHQCLHTHPATGKSYRNGKNFKCGHCGWKGDSDLNGAKMIQIVGQSVSLPGTRNPLFCSLLNSVRD